MDADTADSSSLVLLSDGYVEVVLSNMTSEFCSTIKSMKKSHHRNVSYFHFAQQSQLLSVPSWSWFSTVNP